MTITEAERHLLYQRLEAVLGADEANVLMEHLPPVGWADVATKRDLDHLETVLRAEIANTELRLCSELGAQISGVRSELGAQISGVRSELGAQISGVRSDLGAEVSGLRVELHTGVRDLRNQMFALFGAYTAVAAVAMVVVRLA